MTDLTNLTITQTHEGLKAKQFSAVEVTQAYLDKIKKVDRNINAFLAVTEDLALEQAKEADEKITEGKDFPVLTGVPCAIKDNILVEGEKCTAGSKILEHYVASYSATVIEKLADAGAVILGKTNLDEFAMGASTENSTFFVTKNPHDTSRVAGGSSGGSAAAVASNMACYGLGTDTGGSVRQPASFCGVVGFNPTYGAVSRYGLVAFASSLDQAGPIAKTVDDAKIVFSAVSGKDPKDATSQDFKFQMQPSGVPVGPANFKLKGCRIGVPKEYFEKGIDPDVEKIVKEAIKKAEDAGAEIIGISLPNTKYAMACYYIIAPCEASSNLARFDGIKYGLHKPGNNLLDVYLESRGAGFGAEPKRRILIGTHALSSGYYDAYYKKAKEVSEFIKNDFAKAFEKVDVIFCPVAPTPAFKIGEKAADPLSMYLADVYTSPIKIAGLPGISIPAGKIGKSKIPSKNEGLPVGLQIIGNYFEDVKVLNIASQLEKVLQWC